MIISHNDLTLLIEAILLAKAQLYHPDGDMTGDAVLTKDVKFKWGVYTGDRGSEKYMTAPGRTKLGSVQIKGDPFTYESEGQKARVVSGPESLKKSIGKLVDARAAVAKSPDGNCPLQSPDSFYKVARAKLAYLSDTLKSYRKTYPGEADSMFFKTGFSSFAKDRQKSQAVYDAAVNFEDSFAKLTEVLDKNYSFVEKSKADTQHFAIRGDNSNYCKHIFIKTLYYTGICILLHPGLQNKTFLRARAQKLLNTGSIRSQTFTALGGEGINIVSFIKLIEHIQKRGITGKSADEYFGMASEEDEKYFVKLSSLILSKI